MTTIAINEQTWKRLNTLKKPNTTMNDIIDLLLNYYEDNEDNLADEPMSDQEFDDLINELHVPDEDFSNYLDQSRQSFKREVYE